MAFGRWSTGHNLNDADENSFGLGQGYRRLASNIKLVEYGIYLYSVQFFEL
jgi:hypothetical protein